MKVRRTCCQRAQNRTFEQRHVLPFARNQRAAGIGGLDGLTGRFVPKRVKRHIRRPPRLAGNADIQWQRNGVVPHVRRIVAGGAGASDGFLTEDIVQTADTADLNREGVEQSFAARNGLASIGKPLP